MKSPFLPLISAAAVVAAALSFWPPQAAAQTAVEKPGEAVASPIGRLCVVTLDPQADRDLGKLGDAAFKKSGITTEGTVEGALVTLNDKWVMLRDGSYENWIPAGKVLTIRVSR